MKLAIDNLDGRGPQDYTAAIDITRRPRVVRALNKPAELRVSLVSGDANFVVPVSGARVTLGRFNGSDVFTGYLMEPPQFDYLGWGEHGAIYRYNLVARSDEALLDRKPIPGRSPFVGRSAGDALRELTDEMFPGFLNTAGVEGGDTIGWYLCNGQKKWSEHAATLALLTRGSYRAMNGGLVFQPVGSTVHVLDERTAEFSPGALKLNASDQLLNDVTVIGRVGPSAYVKDYFVGDGLSTTFYLSQKPFTRSVRTLIEEEFLALNTLQWRVADPARAVSVTGGKLQVLGGTGVDGQTTVQFIEKVELCGAVVMQHGTVIFSGASNGILGGLYPDGISCESCLVGFRITPYGSDSSIQAMVNGAASGPVITTQAGHRYAFTTRVYASESYRRGQTFHSPLHPAGQGVGGATIAANVRVVLEVHDIDPTNPGSLVAPSVVLYDDLLNGAPEFAVYALINAINMNCNFAFTRMTQAVNAEVRSALPGGSYRTRLVGAQSDGAECNISAQPSLHFYSQFVPAANEVMVVSYRGAGQARARVRNSVSIAAAAHGTDDGVRSAVHNVQMPSPLTSNDCENAALALLDDGGGMSWSGEYRPWSDYLPGLAQDVFPGDAIAVRVPSRGASFDAIVRNVDIEIADLAGEHSKYTIQFSQDAVQPLAIDFQTAKVPSSLDIPTTDVSAIGSNFLADLTAAEITQVTSTTVGIDCGSDLPAGRGIEVRRSDMGWGQDNDRNLVGRFSTRGFTVPRLARVQDYFLRQYDASSPAKYSRYSAALHIDYPL